MRECTMNQNISRHQSETTKKKNPPKKTFSMTIKYRTRRSGNARSINGKNRQKIVLKGNPTLWRRFFDQIHCAIKVSVSHLRNGYDFKNLDDSVRRPDDTVLKSQTPGNFQEIRHH